MGHSRTSDPQHWLEQFAASAENGDGLAIASQFCPEGIWRDYLPFGWTLQSIEGHADIAEFANRHGAASGFCFLEFAGKPGEDQGFFTFRSSRGEGRGYIRLQDGNCLTLFTMLTDLLDSKSTKSVVQLPTAHDKSTEDPYILIVGGGQGGLALGAQLSHLGVPYLIVDKHAQVGDQWRSRYDSLVLHDPVWYDHMPFVPFPADWPIFTPKDRMGDWLEAYADRLSLSILNCTECTGAQFDTSTDSWRVELKTHKEGKNETRTVKPSHLVFALGISGFPRIPDFKGKSSFEGRQMHSSQFEGGQSMAGENVVVIGANNSAHDIATDLVKHSARPVIVQRSSTLVVRQQDYCEKLLGELYSCRAIAAGVTTADADLLTASMPIRMLEKTHKPIWDSIQVEQQDFYQRLTDCGFKLDFAEDGTGLGLKYRRTASGYYIDVGGSQLVIDGKIGIRSGVTVDRITERSVVLNTGEALAADTIVYATGYGGMTDWIAALIDEDTATRVGPCWGYGSETKGDPGPWLGELRNMWMPTAQQGLWFMGGNLAQTRFYSRLLGLQLQGRFLLD